MFHFALIRSTGFRHIGVRDSPFLEATNSSHQVVALVRHDNGTGALVVSDTTLVKS